MQFYTIILLNDFVKIITNTRSSKCEHQKSPLDPIEENDQLLLCVRLRKFADKANQQVTF